MQRALVALTLFASTAGGCGRTEGGNQDPPLPGAKPSGAAATAAASGELALTGAGATFPYPLYTKWISEYGKAHPDVKINYQSIGSGGGIRQITERTVDFGASDAPMN